MYGAIVLNTFPFRRYDASENDFHAKNTDQPS
jgi:hypothetical protein